MYRFLARTNNRRETRRQMRELKALMYGLVNDTGDPKQVRDSRMDGRGMGTCSVGRWRPQNPSACRPDKLAKIVRNCVHVSCNLTEEFTCRINYEAASYVPFVLAVFSL